MAIQDALAAQLGGAAGLTALVGSRIYWRRAPQAVAYPCVVFKQIGGDPVHAFGSDTGMQMARWLIVALAGDAQATAAEAVAVQVKAALNRIKDVTQAGTLIDSIFMDDKQDIDLDDALLAEGIGQVYRVNYRE